MALTPGLGEGRRRRRPFYWSYGSPERPIKHCQRCNIERSGLSQVLIAVHLKVRFFKTL